VASAAQAKQAISAGRAKVPTTSLAAVPGAAR